MSRAILDIETVGKDFESLDKATREYLLRYAETKEEKEEIKDRLSLYPLFAEIVTIGLLNPDTQKGIVFYQAAGELLLPFEEDNVRYEAGTEKEILERLWHIAALITVNVRIGFDVACIQVGNSHYDRIGYTKWRKEVRKRILLPFSKLPVGVVGHLMSDHSGIHPRWLYPHLSVDAIGSSHAARRG